MTRIDFYILAHSSHEERYRFACKLVERALHSGCKVLLYTQSKAQALSLDQELWVYRPEAFIPHTIQATQATDSGSETTNEGTTDLSARHQNETDPVHLAWSQYDGPHFDVLINLSDEIPPFFSRFERVIEIVVQSKEVLQKTREHYKFYRHRGFPIKDNDLRI